MSLKSLMDNYTEFNQWANETLTNWLLTKPVQTLNTEVASSYPTIMKTALHIWDTERFWLKILEGITPDKFSYHFEGTANEAFKGFIKQSEDFKNYTRSLTDANLNEVFVLNMPWMKGKVPKYELIQHCMNHSTYHRGQIITIGRNVGLTDPPMTDYNYYNMAIKLK